MLLHFLEVKWNWSSPAFNFTLPSINFLINSSQQERIVSKITCPPNNFIALFILVLQLLSQTVSSALFGPPYSARDFCNASVRSPRAISWFRFFMFVPGIKCAVLEPCVFFQIATRITTSGLSTCCRVKDNKRKKIDTGTNSCCQEET